MYTLAPLKTDLDTPLPPKWFSLKLISIYATDRYFVPKHNHQSMPDQLLKVTF